MFTLNKFVLKNIISFVKLSCNLLLSTNILHLIVTQSNIHPIVYFYKHHLRRMLRDKERSRIMSKCLILEYDLIHIEMFTLDTFYSNELSHILETRIEIYYSIQISL